MCFHGRVLIVNSILPIMSWNSTCSPCTHQSLFIMNHYTFLLKFPCSDSGCLTFRNGVACWLSLTFPLFSMALQWMIHEVIIMIFHEFPWFVIDCPLIVHWFLLMFHWCSSDFPMIFFKKIPVIFQWFPMISSDFPGFFHWFPKMSHDFPGLFHWFPMISHDFQWFSRIFPLNMIHSMGILGWAEEVESMPQLESLDLRIHGGRRISSRFYGNPSYILIQSIYIYVVYLHIIYTDTYRHICNRIIGNLFYYWFYGCISNLK